jgi:hypothetical protein
MINDSGIEARWQIKVNVQPVCDVLLVANQRHSLRGKPGERLCVSSNVAEIATRLASRPDAHAATNPYRVWIAEYAGAPYREVAAKARAHLEGLADLYATPAREAELIVIFKEATRLEADFWEMRWRADQRVE